MNYKLLLSLLLLVTLGATAQVVTPPAVWQLDIKGKSRLSILTVPLQIRIPLDTLPHGADSAGLVAIQDSILYVRAWDSAHTSLRWVASGRGGIFNSSTTTTVLNQYFSQDTTIINQINQQITKIVDSSVSIINPQQTLQQVLITGNQLTRSNNIFVDTTHYTWYYRGSGTPIQLGDVGAQITPRSAWNTVAPLLKVKSIRDIVSFNGGTGLYKSISNAGYNVHLTISANLLDGSHYFPAPGDSLEDYKCNFDSLMQEIKNGGYHVNWLSVENSPLDVTIHKDPLHHLSDYLGQLSASVAIASGYGFNSITDGGLGGADFKWVVWDWLSHQAGRSADADEFKLYEFSNVQKATIDGWATDPAHSDAITFCKAYLADLDTIPITAVNFHWYVESWQSDVHANSLMWTIQALKAMSNKTTVTCNEIGQLNSLDNIPPALLTVVAPYMAQTIWFDGDVSGSYGLHDPSTNTLRSGGGNFVNFLQTASTGDTTIQRFLDFINGEIYSVNHKKPYAQRMILDTSGKVTYQAQITTNISVPSADYAIALPEQNQTFILPTLTANHTLTLPAATEGQVIEVWNRNSAGFSWLLAGTVAKDAAETTLTQLANDTYYKLKMLNGNWIKAN